MLNLPKLPPREKIDRNPGGFNAKPFLRKELLLSPEFCYKRTRGGENCTGICTTVPCWIWIWPLYHCITVPCWIWQFSMMMQVCSGSVGAYRCQTLTHFLLFLSLLIIFLLLLLYYIIQLYYYYYYYHFYHYITYDPILAVWAHTDAGRWHTFCLNRVPQKPFHPDSHLITGLFSAVFDVNLLKKLFSLWVRPQSYIPFSRPFSHFLSF